MAWNVELVDSNTPAGYVDRITACRLTLARVAPSHPVLFAPMANRFSSLQQKVADMEDDFRKFYDKGNKAAGTRIRKSMQELKQVAQEIRQEVQAAKQA